MQTFTLHRRLNFKEKVVTNSRIKFLALALAFSLLSVFSSFAQVSITSDNLPTFPGDVFNYYSQTNTDTSETGGIPVDLGTGGGNQVWDFTSFLSEDVSLDSLFDPMTSVYSEEFGDADRALFSSAGIMSVNLGNISRFESFGEDWTLDGVGLLNVALIPDQEPRSMPIQFPEPLKLTPLPLSFEDSWTLLDTISTEYQDSTTGVTFLIELTFGGTFEVDAWGELIYPGGSVDCLRLYAFAGGALNVYPLILGFPLPSIYTREYPAAHNYIWFAPDVGEVATVTSKVTEENPDFELASAVRVYTTNDVSAPEPEVFVANGIALSPAWPNPFNASTTIQFAIPNRQKTRVEIFDILGNSVAVLSDRVYEAGDHSLSWNASDQTSGVYFIRMSTKSASRVQKIMLVK